jgi:ubiquitin-activating enzyme E1 C
MKRNSEAMNHSQFNDAVYVSKLSVGSTTKAYHDRGNLVTLLSRPSAFSNESGALPIGEFEPLSATTSGIDSKLQSFIDDPVLVVGAGGLGCEILKNLALSGIRNVHVIDLDTIDVTNLNRQFLFREHNVGSSKAQVAAEFIHRRCPWMNVTAHHGKIQEKDSDFYSSFKCIISGLDNVEARRWLNATVCGLVQLDEDGDPIPETIIPIIDGGTEGFSGQARVILPRITSCFECSLDAFPPQKSFPLCTVADTPRIPEHCIAYAFTLQWPKVFPDRKLDKDSPEDMQWVYQQALERSKQYNIPGVTYMLTMGVVKNIIPAVASTNAIVAAACVNETVKILTFCSQTLNTYMMYMGSSGIYSHTFVYEKKDDCPVCASTVRKMTVDPNMSLNRLIQELTVGDLRLQNPSITAATSGLTLYMQKPPSLEKATRKNLDKSLGELIQDGEELTVTDPMFSNKSIGLTIMFQKT